MWATRHVIPLMIALGLPVSACGTHVPDIQEIPGDPLGGQQLVQSIVQNVTCEVQDAVHALYRDRKSTFLDTWGVQITLNLTIEEKTAINPVVNWLPMSPPTAIFNLLGGAT